MRQTISCAIIVFNEERNIREALESVRWMDEIVVVDAFSQDKTVPICREFTQLIYQRPWNGFGEQKNYAIDHTTCDWVFILDADERVSYELREEISTMLTRPGHVVAYRIPRRNYYYGHRMRAAGQFPDPQLRLIRRGRGRYNDLPVHEHLEVDGPISELHGHLDHHTHPTVLAHELKIERYSSLAAEERIRNGKPEAAWYHLLVNPVWTFMKFYLLRGGFRDGLPGFVMCGFSAAHVLLKYAKLWERANT
jgi:glycosyltransferase involved in cell wall biosynthesis